MEIVIRGLKTFDMEVILNLYDSVGWTNYTERPDMLEQAFHHSLLVLGAWDGEKLTGIIRVVGDGASIIFIQDLLVLPEYQRHGIGSQLCREVLKRFSSVYQIELLTENTSKTNAFYQSLGFKRVDELGCCAFIRT